MERAKPPMRRCAVYTRKSSEEGLEQDFNSLHAQREACEAFIASQQGEGWKLIKAAYDDGGISGGTMERPALQRLLDDIGHGLIDVVVVYKVDRLTRSLTDFAKMVEIFDGHGVSFVAVTQQFNTTTSMGRLTLNVLLSFAQFEREVTGERIRDKIAASKRKGLWMGGVAPLGYDLRDRALVVRDRANALGPSPRSRALGWARAAPDDVPGGGESLRCKSDWTAARIARPAKNSARPMQFLSATHEPSKQSRGGRGRPSEAGPSPTPDNAGRSVSRWTLPPRSLPGRDRGRRNQGAPPRPSTDPCVWKPRSCPGSVLR